MKIFEIYINVIGAYRRDGSSIKQLTYMRHCGFGENPSLEDLKQWALECAEKTKARHPIIFKDASFSFDCIREV